MDCQKKQLILSRPKVVIIIQFMAQKRIYLDGIDPIDFFGVNNVRFNKLKSLFADLKVISRGNELKVEGDLARIDLMKEKVELMIANRDDPSIIRMGHDLPGMIRQVEGLND